VALSCRSVRAYRGIPPQSASCGAKLAAQGFTESLRCELLHEGGKVAVTMVQVPTVKAPQFDWALSRMRRKALPVPPIYQPEVAARAVVHAADHLEGREYWAGSRTVGTLIANQLAGRWVCLYRAIDQFGQVVDVLVFQKRDLMTTRRFFTRALEHCYARPR
jgi:NAD(P)-dependent dehydrogenase (short-subunit alcohol dehydrogenase family)